MAIWDVSTEVVTALREAVAEPRQRKVSSECPNLLIDGANPSIRLMPYVNQSVVLYFPLRGALRKPKSVFILRGFSGASLNKNCRRTEQ
jgi:hypothetical protein